MPAYGFRMGSWPKGEFKSCSLSLLIVDGLNFLQRKAPGEHLKFVDTSLKVVCGERRPGSYNHRLALTNRSTCRSPVIHQLTVGVLPNTITIVRYHLMYPFTDGEMIVIVG